MHVSSFAVDAQRFRIRDGKRKKLNRFGLVDHRDQVLEGVLGFMEQAEASSFPPRSSREKRIPS